MTQKRLWIAASIIAVVVLVSFMLSVPHTHDVPAPTVVKKEAVTPVVTVHDSFKKGLHIISGSTLAPNACSVVTARSSLVGDASSTQSILVALLQPEDSGICLQVPTLMNFSTSITAPAGLPITVTVNGTTASTTGL